MRYRDIWSEKVFTEDELRKEFEILKANGETDAENFGQYLTNCLGKNGSLEKVADDWRIHKMQESVATDIACKEMPYDKCLEIIQRFQMFESWTDYEINNRPVDVDDISEMVAQELGLM